MTDLAWAKPSNSDIKWAVHHGWRWDGSMFYPASPIIVIPNPVEGRPGWCPWLPAIGALQTDAPFSSPRAAMRVAEAIRRHRALGPDEMSCAEE